MKKFFTLNVTQTKKKSDIREMQNKIYIPKKKQTNIYNTKVYNYFSCEKFHFKHFNVHLLSQSNKTNITTNKKQTR